MGTSPLTCRCGKSCDDAPNEYEFNKGDYLRSKSGNLRIKKELDDNSKSKTLSSLFKSDNFDGPISPRYINNKIRETVPPPIDEVSEENNFSENNNKFKKIMTFGIQKQEDENLEEEIGIDDDIKEKNDNINDNINKRQEFQINPDINEIKYIPNFDKTYFFTKKLKNAEKNFRYPINYVSDYQKYYKEDEDNIDMLILINTMNNNKGINHTKEDGIVIEYRGEKFLYIGETDKDQLPTGFGILYTQGQKYEGNFFRGKLIGLGRFINEEGTCFEGIFENNKLVSKATIITINENNKRVEYFGEVYDFKKNGKGEEICEGEYVYTGEFMNDFKHGEGNLVYFENEEKYKGHFEKGEITGKGQYYWGNGEKYEGDFVKGIKHGKGIYIWPDGCRYEGDYNNGIREGKGQYKWEDGKVFKGMFKNGKPNGKGKIYYNGKSMICEYRNGIPVTDLKKLFKKS